MYGLPTSPAVSDHEEAPAPPVKKTTTTTRKKTAAEIPTPDDDEIQAMGGPSKKRTKKKSVLLTEEQEVEMGEWLRNHPELFTKTMKAYKDASKKNKLWEDKAGELGLVSATSLRTWYESIRAKVGKLSATKSGSARKDVSERDQFIDANFGFLKEHISRVRGRTAMSVSIRI